MSHSIHRYCALFVTLALAFCPASRCTACTGIRLQAKDGAVIYARTMEFGTNLNSDVLIVPRQFGFQGATKSGPTGLKWESKYGVVGLNGLGKQALVDGVNEKGLAGGIFYMPGYAQYQTVTAEQESRSLAPWELVTWILTNFATVDEVRAALPTIRVNDATLDGSYTPPVHYIVHDAAGNSLAIEYLDGQLSLHDDPVGVITNAPNFDWHLKNLDNYVNLTAVNAPSKTVDGLKLSQFGQGSGLLGVPGDFTPPSRFVRAFVLGHLAEPGADGEGAIRQAFHVLDSFDIPLGTVRNAQADGIQNEFTQWTSASDTKNLRFYFHTLDNRRIRRVDLPRCDFEGEQITVIPLGLQEDYQDLTPRGEGA